MLKHKQGMEGWSFVYLPDENNNTFHEVPIAYFRLHIDAKRFSFMYPGSFVGIVEGVSEETKRHVEEFKKYLITRPSHKLDIYDEIYPEDEDWHDEEK